MVALVVGVSTDEYDARAGTITIFLAMVPRESVDNSLRPSG